MKGRSLGAKRKTVCQRGRGKRGRLEKADFETCPLSRILKGETTFRGNGKENGRNWKRRRVLLYVPPKNFHSID